MAKGMKNAGFINSALHRYLGCHTTRTEDGYTTVFRMYDTDAKKVYLSGDHNGWATDTAMTEIGDGVWEYILKTDTPLYGLKYKYLAVYKDGSRFIADPFASEYEADGERASLISDERTFLWEDRLWRERRHECADGEGSEFFPHPLNIYEVHLQSWKKDRDGGCLGLRELANELSEYVKQLGCTHIAIVSDGEYPYIGRFAPAFELGCSDGMKYLVNKLHSVGIGVIFDLVTACRDSCGRAVSGEFADALAASNAVFLLEELHADGLKLTESDGAADTALTAVVGAVRSGFPDALLIAESADTHGVDLVYNRMWTECTLNYITVDPLFRRSEHERLTLPLDGAFGRRHLLSFAHGDMSGGKRSLLNKSYGSYDMKFAGTRLTRAYQMTFPGKKLTFMGAEYGPFKEWDRNGGLEWFMLDFERHRQLLDFTAELGNFYLSEPCLWERDFSADGFEWIYPHMSELNIIAYRRLSADGGEAVVLLNFAPVDREGFTVINMKHKRYKEVFSTDAARFGGTNKLNFGVLDTVPVHDGTRSLKLTLPGLSAVILKPI